MNDNQINNNSINSSNITPNIESLTNIPENNHSIPKKKKLTTIIIIIIVVLIVIFAIMGLYYFKVISKNEKEKNKKTRTIMIYASPTNLESEARAFTIDINELDYTKYDHEHVNVLIYTGGTSYWHNFVQNDENAIYKLTELGFEKIESYDQLNMSSADTLLSFLNYVYENYKTDYYDLLFYDHGGAISGSIIDDFAKDDILTLNEMTYALENSYFKGDNKLEMIMFRTCLMGSLEIAKIVEPYANYLVASEDSIYMGGFNVGCLDFIEKITGNSKPLEIAQNFIDNYDYYNLLINTSEVYLSYSIMDLSKIDNVFTEYLHFLNEIDIDSNYGNIAKARKATYTYSEETNLDMTDLGALVTNMADISNYDYEKVLEAIDDAVIYLSTNDYYINNGISIYFPTSNNNYTEYLINIYNYANINNTYFAFIDKYYGNIKNKTSQAITADILNKGKISNNEFSYQLTDEQAKDFASAKYMIMKKFDNDYYMPIYTSNDAYLDNNILKTDIVNKIIRIKNVTNKEGKSINDAYIPIFSSPKEDGKTYYKTYANLNNWDENTDPSKWKTISAELHIMIENGKPVIKTITENSNNENKSFAKITLDPKEFKNVEFISPSYKLLDKNGNYIGKTEEQNPIVYGYKEKLSDLELEFTDLENSGEYYCVFVIEDIYGNTTNTKAIKLTK